MKRPLIPGEIRTSEDEHIPSASIISNQDASGKFKADKGEYILNKGKKEKELVVVNDGDRPIQVGSHFHFADCNPALNFDRQAAKGYRLAIPAGKSVRFEPGASKTVFLIELAGKKIVRGLQVKNTSNE